MAKQPHSSFDALASVIEQLGSGGRSVNRVEAAAEGGDGELRATVDVAVPLDGLGGDDGADAVALEPSGTAGGEPRFDLRLPGLRSALDADTDADADVTVRPLEASLRPEGVAATLEVVIASRGNGRSETPLRRGADSGTASGSSPEPSNPTATGAERRTADGHNGSESSPSSSSGTPEDARDGDLAAVRDESVPPYADTAYLRRLYETCETFDEMSERIEMDVSAETVRRYMIDADVHSPQSYALEGADVSRSDDGDSGASPPRDDGDGGPTTDPTTDGSATADDPADGDASAEASTGEEAIDEGAIDDGAIDEGAVGGETIDDGADGDADGDDAGGSGQSDADAPADGLSPESLPDEQLIADGIGLPETLTLSDVVEAVVDARTVHEVGRDLGLDHDRTRRLLRQLDLLDLVLCRVSNASSDRCSVETVAGRIRRCTTESAEP